MSELRLLVLALEDLEHARARIAELEQQLGYASNPDAPVIVYAFGREARCSCRERPFHNTVVHISQKL